MTQWIIYKKGVKFVEIFHFRFANKDLKSSIFRSSSKQRNSSLISEYIIYVDSICYNFTHFMENKNGSIFLAARGRF